MGRGMVLLLFVGGHALPLAAAAPLLPHWLFSVYLFDACLLIANFAMPHGPWQEGGT